MATTMVGSFFSTCASVRRLKLASTMDRLQNFDEAVATESCDWWI